MDKQEFFPKKTEVDNKEEIFLWHIEKTKVPSLVDLLGTIICHLTLLFLSFLVYMVEISICFIQNLQ